MLEKKPWFYDRRTMVCLGIFFGGSAAFYLLKMLYSHIILKRVSQNAYMTLKLKEKIKKAAIQQRTL